LWLEEINGPIEASGSPHGQVRIQHPALCLMAALLFSNLSRAISAAAGDLDPSFDVDSKVTTNFASVKAMTSLSATGCTASLA
jgi:hypothetical protein